MYFSIQHGHKPWWFCWKQWQNSSWFSKSDVICFWQGSV